MTFNPFIKTDAFSMQSFNDKFQEIVDGFNEEIKAAAEATPVIAVGSYTGTGTYGSENPTSLSFDFQPTLVLVFDPGDSNYQAVCFPGRDTTARIFGANSPRITVTWDNNTVSWYADAAAYQFNSKTSSYLYFAI